MSDTHTMRPPVREGRSSAFRVAEAWYVACRSTALAKGPLAVTLLGTPLVLFRGEDGRPAAFLDRCPHRNVPLSGGEVEGGCLRCPYHGWRFAADGACVEIPGLLSERHDTRGRRATALPVRELDGLVWVWASPEVEPDVAPYRIPHLGDHGYDVFYDVYETAGTVYAVAENALDVPHTAFLHKGLFRGSGETNEIDVVLRRWHDRVEAEYIGEPAPKGLVGRLLAPKGGVVSHFDRFFLPSVAQVEYAMGDRAHVVVTSALSPITEDRTRLFAVVTFKLPVPRWLVTPVLEPLGRRIFGQDAEILARQAENIERFGGEDFVSTEIDVLGPHIHYLLRKAAEGTLDPRAAPFERRFRMRA